METGILERIGLTKNESLVYLSLLNLGTAKTGEILNKSGINSGKIYEILESLKLKGLVSESIISNVRHFSAAPAQEILNWLDKRKDKIEQDKQTVTKELSAIEKLRHKKIRETKAITYTGFNGLKTAVYEALDSLKRGDEIMGMGITHNKEEKFNEFWLKFGEERAKMGIKAKNLFSDRGEFLDKYKKIKITTNRVLEGITPVTLDIFGDDKVLILNYNDPISCILIYDKNTASSFKNFFYQLWAIAKK